MEHLAMLENGEDLATTTTWLEHITDEEYRGVATTGSGSADR